MQEVTSDNTSIRRVAVIGSGLAAKRVTDGSADVGAQYFTARHPGFLAFLSEKAGDTTFAPWGARLGFQSQANGWQPFPEESRFVGTPRMTAITRALSAHVELEANVRIHRLQRDGRRWHLEDTEGNVYRDFDRVVITAPPAQASELLHNSGMAQLAERLVPHVEGILPCWAVAAHFPSAVDFAYQGARPHSDTLFWLANNSSKPGREDKGQWWVLHATPDWTNNHLETPEDQVADTLVAEFQALTGHQAEPVECVTHWWLYARSEATDCPGYLYDHSMGVGLAGDWLAGGRVEGAWDSARQLVECIDRD